MGGPGDPRPAGRTTDAPSSASSLVANRPRSSVRSSTRSPASAPAEWARPIAPSSLLIVVPPSVPFCRVATTTDCRGQRHTRRASMAWSGRRRASTPMAPCTGRPAPSGGRGEEVPTTTPVAFDDCELDLAGLELRRGGRPVHLEPQVFDVLNYLVTHRERVVPKSELLDQVWRDR